MFTQAFLRNQLGVGAAAATMMMLAVLVVAGSPAAVSAWRASRSARA
jgi:hypothetical protein